MAIAGIDPKCYILALFVRDDGVRFLLGDDPYEFKDKQLHFQPNTVANDVVEVQGNDGYLLAGQVRRPGTQSFDGYVCNGTNSKAEVEVKRREFLQFFRRSHFYKVIYVFPNGTAIQRKQGFLVDDPTVQELYQQYPEYHVALNFEDVNYYTYEEDDQGQEIYAKEAIVPLAGGGATGGLTWDEYGVVWEGPWSDLVSVSGSEIQIDNDAGARAPIQDLELQGDTYQQTYSGKNLVYTVPRTNNGITFSYNSTDGTTTFSGTPTAGYAIATKVVANIPSGTYTMSIDAPKSYRVEIGLYDSNNVRTSKSIVEGNTYTTFTLGTNMSGYDVTVSRLTVGASISGEFKLMLESGSSQTSFEPYVGGTPAPNPDYPQPVQVVTGEQTVTVSGDDEASQTYAINLGSTELCKIGNYQDYIYKSGEDWYLHKEIGSEVLDGDENWRIDQTGTQSFFYSLFLTIDSANTSTSLRSNYGVGGDIRSTTTANGIAIFNQNQLRIRYGQEMSIADWKSKLVSNNMIVYTLLATPTDTQITDATLIGQLDALGAMKLFIGENNLLVSATGTNLPATLEFSYPTKFAKIGAEWEEGGTKGATIVDVNAIDNTYPVWELMGPAVNPTISVLTTNTTLTYNGTITASQKLVIDMFNKTATLNGTSVIGNVSGDFVYMAPGTNRIAYTAENTDAPDSTIYWQEVVG